MWPVGKNGKSLHIYWQCACDCGGYALVRGNAMTSGAQKSCGCLSKEQLVARQTKHGHSSSKNQKVTPEYRSWSSMKKRCLRPETPNYKYWGGKGVIICDRWLNSFENFLADMGLRPKGTTIDRWPNKRGNYEPGNCRWATPKQQRENQDVWPNTKIARQSPLKILSLYRAGKTQSEVAALFGVAQATIGSILKETVTCRK